MFLRSWSNKISKTTDCSLLEISRGCPLQSAYIGQTSWWCRFFRQLDGWHVKWRLDTVVPVKSKNLRKSEIYNDFMKMAEVSDFGPRKTMLILAIVAGCFAVLFPKIFYPMLTGSVNSQHSTPVEGSGKFLSYWILIYFAKQILVLLYIVNYKFGFIQISGI